MDGENTPRGMSRRDLLKKGGLVLGAAAWMTPAMQVLNMTPAMAEDGYDPQCESPMESMPSKPSKPREPSKPTTGGSGPDPGVPSPPDRTG